MLFPSWAFGETPNMIVTAEVWPLIFYRPEPNMKLIHHWWIKATRAFWNLWRMFFSALHIHIYCTMLAEARQKEHFVLAWYFLYFDLQNKRLISNLQKHVADFCKVLVTPTHKTKEKFCSLQSVLKSHHSTETVFKEFLKDVFYLLFRYF